MSDTPNRQLLINYLLGLCAPHEEKEVESWLEAGPENALLLQKVAKDVGSEEVLSAEEKKDIKSQLLDQIERKGGGHNTSSSKKGAAHLGRAVWLKAAVVIIFTLMAAGIGFYYSQPVESLADVELKQRSLSRGQTATLRFGDGTVINLNAGSTLRYPARFSSNLREVYLEGEAFFSVARDTSRPFIIHTANTTTKVLGTSFNIKAYKSEGDIQVAVAEGKVAVTKKFEADDVSSENSETIYLKKNQWVTYRPAEQVMEKGEGNIRPLIAWKDKVMVFNDKPLQKIANRLERWYNVDISLADSTVGGRRMSATFEDETFTEVISTIALTLNIDITYKHEGQHIIFEQKNNK